jgi:hypothetical protein
MNVFLAGSLALMIALVNCQRCHVVIHTAPDETQQVAQDFSYPESPETTRDEIPYKANSLAGRVVDPTGAGLEKALVERLNSGWKKRINATFTDSQGSFSFSQHSGKMQFLKISKPGFNTLLVKVAIKKNLNSQLNLKLGVSH